LTRRIQAKVRPKARISSVKNRLPNLFFPALGFLFLFPGLPDSESGAAACFQTDRNISPAAIAYPSEDRSPSAGGDFADVSDGFYHYRTQAGDSLSAVAARFNAFSREIQAVDGSSLRERGFLPPGRELTIPKKFSITTESTHWFPDSEIVFSRTSEKFNAEDFIRSKGGYLSAYTDQDGRPGDAIIMKLARENSINPRILLALLEYTSGWVTNPTPAAATLDYPMRFRDVYSRGLDRQMMLAINYPERGYCGWRSANILCPSFTDGQTIRLAPDLNAGTVAVTYYFSKITGDPAAWKRERGKFFALYAGFFGDPRESALDPLFPQELDQPDFILPFSIGQSWCFSNGPHGAWDAKGPAAAIDFAPPQFEYSGPQTRLLLASATGCVVRADPDTVMIDLDCDGDEHAGWDIFSYHVSEEGKARLGSKVHRGQKIGYASSEGGLNTGIHVHMAHKFNGEWMLADGPLPFSVSRWTLTAGGAGGEWFFLRDGAKIAASVDCDFEDMIYR
jgi:LasA protease